LQLPQGLQGSTEGATISIGAKPQLTATVKEAPRTAKQPPNDPKDGQQSIIHHKKRTDRKIISKEVRETRRGRVQSINNIPYHTLLIHTRTITTVATAALLLSFRRRARIDHQHEATTKAKRNLFSVIFT